MATTRSQTLTVADAGTTSNAFIADGSAVFGLMVPSTFDGTAITFTVSADSPDVVEASATYQPLYEYNTLTNDGVATRSVGLTIAASQSYDLPAALTAWPRWKIVCGTAQTGATAFVVVGKAP